MSLLKAFPKITQANEPLARHTHLRIGGPAEFFVQPTTIDELKSVLSHCKTYRVPLRMLGGGFNLLVRDEPVPGVVMRLVGPAFSWVNIEGKTIRAAGGTPLYTLISHAVQAKLTGLETLVGIQGSVGGSVRCNVGDRSGEIGANIRQVAVLSDDGSSQTRSRDELTFGDHSSDLDEPVIEWVEFQLETDSDDAILKRMRRAWIQRKGAEPLSFQSSVRMFRNPPGASAAQLIDRAGLTKTKVGSAEVSDRNGNYVVAHPGTTAQDILDLIELVQSRVHEHHGIHLEQELRVW